MNTAENRAFWDGRAALGEIAGTRDLILKELEQRALMSHIAQFARYKSVRALELGCGVGETARLVSRCPWISSLTAVDSSEAMIVGARTNPSGVWFIIGDAMNPPSGPFDVVYTQRCLINLPRWSAQHAAIDAIAEVLAPNGRFFMCEHSADGLDALNVERAGFGLDAMPDPSSRGDDQPKNCYLRDADLETIGSLRLVRCDHFSARYYYHSRVINAWLAQREGRAPDYAAPVNQMCLETDRSWSCAPEFAQGRLWVWEKP